MTLKKFHTGMKALFIGAACLAMTVQAEGYSKHPQAAAFVERMVTEHGFKAEEVMRVLAKAEKKQAILDAIARPAERTKPWFEYRQIFLGDTRVVQGVEFWKENAETLARAAEHYGVEPSIIVAIIGVETRYGRFMGNHRVIDALTTLGFDYPPRGKFFASELEHFFLLTREQQQDPLSLTGSYAGAMGYGQFIPSSYRHYARDNDGDGLIDIWSNKSDAIGSVANYFKAHGWQKDGPVMVPARITDKFDREQLNSRNRPDTSVEQWQGKGISAVAPVEGAQIALPLQFTAEKGEEYWLGFNNFYVITRYNRSHLYARAVWELSEEIKAAWMASSAKQ